MRDITFTDDSKEGSESATEGVKVRPLEATDVAFVTSTWLHHYKSNSYFAKRIRHSIYFEWHHKLIQNILSKPTSRALIAHPEGMPEVILGFLVIEDKPKYPVIHFTFVKEELRRMGIARKMIKASGIDFERAYFTHWTFLMNDLLKKFPTLTHSPYDI